MHTSRSHVPSLVPGRNGGFLTSLVGHDCQHILDSLGEESAKYDQSAALAHLASFLLPSPLLLRSSLLLEVSFGVIFMSLPPCL